MCAEFQDDDRHKLFLYPRGTFKTSIITMGGAIMEIINDPNVRILISNANLENAKTILKGVRDHFVYNEKFRRLYPDVCPVWKKGAVRDFGTQTEFTVPNRRPGIKEATVEVGSVEGNLVSRHYDVHIGDDLVSDKNTTTKEQIDKVDFFRKAVYSLLEPSTSKDILVGTRWHWDDIYGRIIDDPESPYKIYKRAIWEKDEEGNLKSVFPKRFPVKEIKAIRKKQGNIMFANQYMNEPLDDETATFKREWFFEYEIDADNRHITVPGQNGLISVRDLYVVTAIDPAVSQAVRSDYTAIVTIGVGPYDETYVLEAKRGKWNPLELINEIFNVHLRWQPMRIGIESFGFQKSIQIFLVEEMRRRQKYLPIQELVNESNKSKEARIVSLQPRVQYCKFYVRHDMNDLIDELLRFPKAKHDDLADALAYTEQLRRTPERRSVPEVFQGQKFGDMLKEHQNKLHQQKKIGSHRLTAGRLING